MITHFAAAEDDGFIWVDVTNPSVAELHEIAKDYQLPESVVEDCLEPDHLPKYEALQNDAVFIITRMYDKKADIHAATIQELTRKVAIFHHKNYLVTIHRSEQPFLAALHAKYVLTQKCTNSFGMVCKILQEVLLSYEEPALKLADELDVYESKIVLDTESKVSYLKSLYYIKVKATISRRIIILSRAIVDKMDGFKEHSAVIQELHDDYVHVETVHDELIEGVTNLLHIYISLSSQKTNEVMRVLTIFSVFFMPLTFIVGVYGMNFRVMPELELSYGYPVVWLAMIAITVFIFFWFRRKRWL